MKAVPILAVLAFAVVGCGGGGASSPAPTPATTASVATSTTTAATAPAEAAAPDEEPGTFLETLTTRRFQGQHGRAWESLHPEHKAVVPRSRFVACQNDEDATGLQLTGFDVLEVFEEPVAVGEPGGDEVPSTAVTFKATVKLPLLKDPLVHSGTAHLVAVDGAWTWLLPPASLEAYRAGDCPDD